MRASARFDHQDVSADATVATVYVREGLSTLFEVRVELRTLAPDLDLSAMLWSTAAVTVTAHRGTSGSRSWHGVIEEARYTGRDDDGHYYAFVLRPTLHGLGYRVRTRIFQQLSAVDIVKQVLTDAGVPEAATRWDTQADFPIREHCTQYKESELSFVLRLLEDEGIFYWFEHTEVDHLLCFGDAIGAYRALEGDPILPVAQHRDQELDTLFFPVVETKLTHDATRTRDWFFESPTAPLQGDSGEAGVRQRYEYGGYAAMDAGPRATDLRLEEAWHDRFVLRAETSCLRVEPGRKLDLIEVQPEPLAREWLVTRAEHHFELADRDHGGVADVGVYGGSLRAIPSDVVFRPRRVTPKPRAHGLESAVVTGPSGEEIHVDEYGRIKVHFYWDRENPVDDTASCWVRFSQLNTQGAMILPRLGWEVHVAFVDGDPDRPVAMHKVYNAETMPPYGLPANKTQAALQSSTSPGGGSTNEIRLQDGNGGMEWFLHASKDLNVVVAHDENETVGVDADEAVGNTMTSSVGGDETGSVGANQSVSVTSNSATETAGSKTVTIGANDDWGITGNFGFGTGGDRSETIGGLMNVLANKIDETFNATCTRNVGAVQAIASATAIAETVGGSKTETVAGAKAIVTPKEHAEAIGGTKTLTSGLVTVKTGGDVTYGAKGAVALTAAGLIQIDCGEDAMFTGSQVRVTSGSAKMKGGGGTFSLGGSITIDAKKFGGKGGPMLKLKGTLDYKD